MRLLLAVTLSLICTTAPAERRTDRKIQEGFEEHWQVWRDANLPPRDPVWSPVGPNAIGILKPTRMKLVQKLGNRRGRVQFEIG